MCRRDGLDALPVAPCAGQRTWTSLGCGRRQVHLLHVPPHGAGPTQPGPHKHPRRARGCPGRGAPKLMACSAARRRLPQRKCRTVGLLCRGVMRKSAPCEHGGADFVSPPVPR